MIHHIKRATRHLLFWSLITTAVGLTALRLLLMEIGHFKADLETAISTEIGTTVSIGHLKTRMHGFQPELRLTDLNIASVDNQASPAIQLQEIRLSCDLLTMLLKRDFLSAAGITLVGSKLNILRKTDGSISIQGLKASGGQPLWLLQGDHYQMLNSQIHFQDDFHPGKVYDVVADLAIINAGERHNINAIIQLPEQFGETLTVSMALDGNFFQPNQVNGKLFADSHALQLSALNNYFLANPSQLTAGLGTVRLWGEIKNSQLTDLVGEVAIGQLHGLSGQQNELLINELHSLFHWYQHPKKDGYWQLDIARLLIDETDKNAPDSVLSLSGDYAMQQLGITVNRLDLPQAASIGAFLLPEASAKLLVQAQLRGELDNFSAFVDRRQQLAAINGTFKNISFAPVANIPGIDNVSGAIKGDNFGGKIHFNTEKAFINYPSVFREALVINKLAGPFKWRQTTDDWQISSGKFQLDLNSINSIAKLRLKLPKNPKTPPFMDLQMAFSGDDVSQLKHYFPTKVMNPADTDWLDKAFIKGNIEQGSMLYYGPLGPIQNAFFEALLDVNSVEFNYAPDWPRFYNVAGRVSFFQNYMICDAYQGDSNNFHLIHATAINTEVGVSKQLVVTGNVEGQLPDALHFLQQTPINKDVGGLITAINTEGHTTVDLNLDLALSAGGYTKVNGTVAMEQNRLQVKAVDLWLKKIVGKVKFTEHGVYGDNINAITLNQAVNLDISHDEQETLIKAKGAAGIEELKNQFVMPFWQHAQGQLDYGLQLHLPLDNSAPRLSVQSNLQGIELDLPGSLAKKSAETAKLAVDFELGNSELLPIIIHYKDQVKAAIKLNTKEKNLYSGHLLLGEGDVKHLENPGLTLEIHQENLNLADLLMFSAGDKQGGGPTLSKLSIHSPQAFWHDQAIGAFKLDLNHEGNYWLGDINSQFAQGKLQIPVNFDQDGKISLHMQLLDLSAIKKLKAGDNPTATDKPPAAKAQASTLLPQNLPLFSINSRKTLWENVDLGTLSLQSERIPDGIAFNQASLLGSEQKLTLSGTWKNIAGTARTSINGSLEVPKAGKFFRNLNITKEFKETNGKMTFLLNWQAPPYDFDLASLSGNVEINLANGRILSIEPGIGRMLGIVAMAQWTKRLQLDFRDIFEAGLSFNTITGNFTIKAGRASTSNLVVDAIPAKITLIGDTNFVDKTLDHTINVIPKSADAVPIAGTIMDNVMTIVSHTLTGENNEGFFLGMHYHAKGKWDNIVVAPLREKEGLFQKTWNGITTFPWTDDETKETAVGKQAN